MTTYTVEQINHHAETHREILAFLESKLPATRSFYRREYNLSRVSIDRDGDIIAKYSRYMGCGEYEYEHLPVHLPQILGETT